MRIAWFLTLHNPNDATLQASIEDLARFRDILRGTPGLERGVVFTPERTHDPYLQASVPPQLAVELYFADIALFEAATAANGYLQRLAAPDLLPSLAGTAIHQQAMRARDFPVPDARPHGAPGVPTCSYLVGYEGPADDPEAWCAHYLAHHTAIMARLPGIREIEVCTPSDATGSLYWPRETCILRNRVVFDDAAALGAALASPVRHEMRTDYAKFPPFRGAVFHYPMAGLEIDP